MFDFLDPDRLRLLLESAGVFAPILFIVLQALQVVIAPIPMQLFGFAGGYAFGAVWGTVYSLCGLIIGTAIAVWLARRFGRPLVNRFVKESIQERFDTIARSNGVTILFLIFLFPGLPDDAICFLAGLSPVRIRDVVVVAALGRLPGIAGVTILGDQVATGQDITMTLIIITAFCVLLGIGYLLRNRFLPKLEKPAEAQEDSQS